MNPTVTDLEVLDWFSHRTSVRRSTVPAHWRERVNRMLRGLHGDPWLERHDVVLVRITPLGRLLAAAFRHGRASVAPGQRQIAGIA